MPEPVFSTEDRVENVDVPADVLQKGPKAIAEFFSKREQQILTEARTAIAQAKTTSNPPPPKNTPNPPVRLTKEAFWEDPEKAARTLIEQGAVTKEYFSQLEDNLQKQMIRMAEWMTKEGKTDWEKWAPEIKNIIKTLPAYQQANPDFWDTAYYNVLGIHMKEIQAEAARAATTIASEVPGNAVETPAAPVDLTQIREPQSGKTAAYVCEKMGITHDTYRKAMERMDKGQWPQTFSNL
jgi:hypothetical protein